MARNRKSGRLCHKRQGNPGRKSVSPSVQSQGFIKVGEPRFYALGSRRKLRRVSPVDWRTSDRRYRQAIEILDKELGKDWVFNVSLSEISDALTKADLLRAVGGSLCQRLDDEFSGVTVVTPFPPATHEGFYCCRATWRRAVYDLREERFRSRTGKVAASKKGTKKRAE